MNNSMKTLLILALTVLPLAGQAAETPPPTMESPAQAAHKAAQSSEKPQGQAAGGAPVESPKTEKENITGKVLQTMNSGGYSYVYLETSDQKVWLALPQTKIVTGETMTFKPGMEMSNFPSSTLKRTFDKIIFSDGIVSSAGTKGAEASPGSVGSVTSGGKIKVDKATGKNAYTVSELYGKSAKLNKKKIVVRGQVVKVSAGIMNKNWIHIQDGSGSAKKGTHNLVVTSQDMPIVGDVVLVKGTLYKDKDFGGNYKYKVIVEEATATKE